MAKDTRLRVIFLWSDISGYMAACWRALSNRPDLNVKVLAYSSSTATSFSRDTMEGIDWHPLEPEERENEVRITELVAAFKPDVIVVVGWLNRAYKSLVTRPEFLSSGLVMTMDTPWSGDLRQRIAPFVLHRYLARMDAVVVTGERSFQYARQLGVAERKIFRGLYGVDHDGLGVIAERRASGNWPRRFLFAGRYAQEKALDVLVAAYQLYREGVDNPFSLVTCGQGPLGSLLENVPGVEDRGFCDGASLHNELAAAGCFVMASRFDPWPLALVEACAAGLPIVATSACGSAVENVRDHVNGFVVPADDIDALAGALTAIDAHFSELQMFGAASRSFAAAYSAEVWVRRWEHLLRNSAIRRC